MHTLNGGWVGQTFALAKCNESDSGGRKSRIRRSKEERKAMVESFINKYQEKNNGDFPSLNLTHKEVGGSFYTVREIVREVIQENRVLGPAKSTSQEEKSSDDQFSQEYPLGSIAFEPQTPVSLPPNGTQHVLVSSLNDGDTDDRVESFDEKHNADKELQIINGTQVDLKNDEYIIRDEAGVVDQSAASTSQVIDLTNVVVETFPLKSITDTEGADGIHDTEGADGIHDTEGEVVVSAEISKEKQNADLSLRPAIVNSQLSGLGSQEESAPEDEKVEMNQGRLVVAVGESPYTGDSIVAQKFANMTESSDSFRTKEGNVHDDENGKSLTDEELPRDASSSKGPEDIRKDASVQAINVPNGIASKSMNGSLRKADAEKSFQETKIKPSPDGPPNGSIPKESNPTLDRINLREAWEVSSRNSSRRESNPLLAIFKSFLEAFMKFWSE